MTVHSKGEKITAKAHGGLIDIYGTTIAEVDDKLRVQKLDTYFDPLEMFRQIAPAGIVNKQIVDSKIDRSAALDDLPSHDGATIGKEFNEGQAGNEDGAQLPVRSAPSTSEKAPEAEKDTKTQLSETQAPIYDSTVNGAATEHMKNPSTSEMQNATGTDEVDKYLQSGASIHPHPKDVEEAVKPQAGEAVAAAPDAKETKMTHEEMSKTSAAECPFLLNRE